MVVTPLKPSVDYVHTTNVHSLAGARAGVRCLFADAPPATLLDVGCGLGTWMRAAAEMGVGEVVGIDGNRFEDRGNESDATFNVDPTSILRTDLTRSFDLGRKFDAAICLEVGEHLPGEGAATLVSSLCVHSDKIYFSAACPGQHGQHHVNCQWPVYWQSLFNRMGFACDDGIRWRMWSEADIEPWYRQNIFAATRDAGRAGKEPRIRPVVHPDMLPYLNLMDRVALEGGMLPVLWYARCGAKALVRKARALLGRPASVA